MLLVKPPKEILGRPIETDFKKWLKFGKMWAAPLTIQEKINLSFLNVLGEIPDKQQEEWLKAIMEFYSCNKNTDRIKPSKDRLLDWEIDSPAIWADFMVYVGIDLDKTNMHWWEFMALFQSLPKDARIKQIISDRSIDLSKIKDPDLRAEYYDRKMAVSLDVIDDFEDGLI